MKFRNTEYTLRVDASGGFTSGEAKRVQIAADGTEFPAQPVDFAEAELQGLLAGFNIGLLTENNSLKRELANERADAAAMQALQRHVSELESRFASLLVQLPFDPRKITVEAFLNRLTQGELFMLFYDADPGVQAIAEMLKEWAANDWPIDFDSDQFKQAMGYLTKLSPERIREISRDATSNESPASQS